MRRGKYFDASLAIQSILLAGFMVLVSHIMLARQWRMAEVPLQTPWAADVNPDQVLPAYPRPMMQRTEWLNLNGLWQFAEATPGSPVPRGKKLKQNILVPFAWEAALSGQRRQLASQQAWYRRTFTVPKGWQRQNQRILLHFGAVDWQATVYVNGHCVGTHQGGYDAFSFDITNALAPKPSSRQELIVHVYDPGSNEGIAVGKQRNDRFAEPQRYTYAPVSGIWQTVWLEPVPEKYITDIRLVPDIDAEQVAVTVNLNTQQAARLKATVKVIDGQMVVGQATGRFNQPFYVSVPEPRLWSPDSPFLYTVQVTLHDSTGVKDQVESYVGMRKISLKRYKNLQRLALNNEFLFQMGPLDQGYWPDGLYTAPTDAALKWDVAQAKAFGYNMIRKHIKIEPQRWYYWCDKLGILVWQDMPSTFKQRTEAEKTQFETELQQMVKTHWNHPSIINWVVFNEHWGLYDVQRLTRMVMAMDPSRLVTGNSGIDAGKPDVDYVVGHIKDDHSYRPPTTHFGNDTRAIACGEYGAIGYKVEGHIWDVDGPWVHHNYADKQAATEEYVRFVDMLLEFQEEGLSAAVYTQWTDLENEMNGLYTYDRKVIKLNQKAVTEANQSTYARDRMKAKYE